MTLQDATALIQHNSITGKATANWVDLGCGSGLFTYALAGLLQKGSTIHAIDKSPVTLQKMANPQHINIYAKQLDFVKEVLPYEDLDGILMANSLHFVHNKAPFITQMGKHLGKQGIFLVVEYDTDTANPWVPYPVSCQLLEKLFAKAGFSFFRKLQEIPSVYQTSNIYAAIIKQ